MANSQLCLIRLNEMLNGSHRLGVSRVRKALEDLDMSEIPFTPQGTDLALKCRKLMRRLG